MKLLFDQNLSPNLDVRLRDVYQGSTHVRDVGLERADDSTVWAYAAEHELTILEGRRFPSALSSVRISAESDLDTPWQLFD